MTHIQCLFWYGNNELVKTACGEFVPVVDITKGIPTCPECRRAFDARKSVALENEGEKK